MKGVILHKGNQIYTYLKSIFETMHDIQVQYKWLITECNEWYDIFFEYQCICCEELKVS